MPFPNPDTQFKRGGPGGPGRPRTKTILEAVRERLAESPGDERTLAQAVADKWLEMIDEGGQTGVAALKFLVEMMHGKAPLKIEADIKATHHSGDLPGILEAFGYVPLGSGSGRGEASPGSLQSGGPGDGALPGQVEAAQAPPVAGLEVEGRGGGPVPEALDLDAAAARQK
jgi:hypothetical protein